MQRSSPRWLETSAQPFGGMTSWVGFSRKPANPGRFQVESLERPSSQSARIRVLPFTCETRTLVQLRRKLSVPAPASSETLRLAKITHAVRAGCLKQHTTSRTLSGSCRKIAVTVASWIYLTCYETDAPFAVCGSA